MDEPVTTYRVLVSREDPWWTAVAYGEGLPAHGAATETRTVADLEHKIRDLIVLRTDADLHMPYEEAARSFSLEWDYAGLPAEAADALAGYHESKLALEDAQTRHAERSQRAASVLAAQTHASVRDIARLMGISYQRVAQLLSAMRNQVAHL
jgi:hypothetical protein